MNYNNRNEPTSVETTMARLNQSARKSTTVKAPRKQLTLPNTFEHQSFTSDSTDSDSEVFYFEEIESDDNYSDSEDEVEVVKEEPSNSLFEEISELEVLESAKSKIQAVQSNVDDVSEPEARRRLQNNQWDVDKAQKDLKKERKRSRKSINKMGLVKRQRVETNSSALECEVCMDEILKDNVANLTCSHLFCKMCLKDSILENINNRIVDVECPGVNCGHLVSLETILDTLAEEKLKSKFLRLLGQSYVDNNKNTAWCPGTDCEIAFRCKEFHNNYNVKCSKGHKSCFNCQGPWHDPLDCDMRKKVAEEIRRNRKRQLDFIKHKRVPEVQR